MTLRQLWQWWNDVWFAPQPVTPICLYRIFFGLLVVQFGLLLWPNLLTFFGEQAIVSAETARSLAPSPALNILLVLPSDDHALIAFFLVFIVAALFLTVGLFTRASAFVVFLG